MSPNCLFCLVSFQLMLKKGTFRLNLCADGLKKCFIIKSRLTLIQQSRVQPEKIPGTIFFGGSPPHPTYFVRVCRAIINPFSIVEIPINWFIAVWSLEQINRVLFSYNWETSKKGFSKFRGGEVLGASEGLCVGQNLVEIGLFWWSNRPKRCPSRGKTRGNQGKAGRNC